MGGTTGGIPPSGGGTGGFPPPQQPQQPQQPPAQPPAGNTQQQQQQLIQGTTVERWSLVLVAFFVCEWAMHFVTNEDQMSRKRGDLYIVQANHRRATGDKSKNKEKAVAGRSKGSTEKEDRHAHEPVRGSGSACVRVDMSMSEWHIGMTLIS
jgi:hypothetical protein